MPENAFTIVGNLGKDPDLHFTNSGDAVVNFSVCHTPRVKRNGEWADGDPLWMRCSAWRTLAENIAESLSKGDRVIVTGRLKQREWEDRESGQKRVSIEMDVDEIGASLKFRQVKVMQAERSSRRSREEAPPDDPWGSAPPAGGSDDEPPF
jgi:single-strand DNA-binding protein